MTSKGRASRPLLREEMSLSDFREYYWMKADLIAFARRLGLRTHGYKPELVARIERRLRGLPDSKVTKSAASSAAGRDSDKPLRRATPVVSYKSDDRTRAFFEEEIGPRFHFTYHLNQYRLHNPGLTYGALVDEWVAEYQRRRKPGYEAPIAPQGEYNRYVRAFFADPANKGKTLRDVVEAWKKAKRARGDRRYVATSKKRRRRK